jgi:iron complex outermembrane receptor protein
MSTSPFRPQRRAALAIAISLALPGLAAAQSGADAEAQSAATLDAIQVTTQRRVENVQDVPVAITAISDEKLNVLASGGEDIRFLSGRVPSLNIESSFGRAFPRFYIRGLGNGDFDLNASQPVSLVYDDIVQENPLLKGFPAFDLEQVEVARGPQGSLFGRNTPAGLVKFSSVRPSQDAEGYVQASIGTDAAVNVEGAYGGALTDRWSARVSAISMRRDDSVRNTAPGAVEDELEGFEEQAYRAQFLYEGEGFEALLGAHSRHLDGTARLFRANIFQPGSNDFVPGFDRDTVSIDGVNSQVLEAIGANARLRWDLGRTTLYSITGWESADSFSRGDIDGGYGAVFLPDSGPGFIPFDAQSADGLPDHDQFTQEVRLESNDWGRFDWQVGAFFFDESLRITSLNYATFAPGQPVNGQAFQEQDNTAWAIYGSGQFDITESLELRAGLRYTDDAKDFVAWRTESPINEFTPGVPEQVGPLYANPGDTNISWDLALVQHLTDDVNVFGRVATGFRAPSIQGRLLFGDALSVAGSEEVTSLELGVKADLFDRRVRLGATVFQYRVDDQQLTAVGGGSNFNTLVNAERTRGRGVELDLEAWVTDSLLVTLGSSWNDTEIQDPGLAVAICGSGCTVTDPTIVVGGSTLALIDGNPLPQAPEFVHNLTARWGTALGDGELFVYTDWYYRSEVNFFLYESREYTGKSLVEGGLRVGYGWDAYEVAVFGRNILDETVAVGGIDFNNLTGFLNEPRTVGVEFTARF